MERFGQALVGGARPCHIRTPDPYNANVMRCDECRILSIYRRGKAIKKMVYIPGRTFD